MKLANLQKRLDDAENSATTEGVHTAQIESRLANLHTGCPGSVVAFDSDKQTAQCQPGIKRIFIDKGAVSLPVLVDCPVYFPGGGGFVLTCPPAAGDECWLAFSERALDFWWSKGGVQLPSEWRMHDLSDAVCFVGLRSQATKLGNFNGSAAELRTVDGLTVVRLEPGKVSLASGQGVTLYPAAQRGDDWARHGPVP